MARRPVHDDFDGAWKNMLSEQRLAAFLAFFMPEAHDAIDWSRKTEFLEQELRAITRKTRRGQGLVDRLVKVWLTDGSQRWVLIHIEIQSQVDPSFPARMLRYYSRGRDLLPAFPERSFACLAILGDEDAAWKPDRYADTFWQTSVEFRYRVVKLKEYEDRLEELEHSANPFVRFVLAHLKTLATQGDYETRLGWKLRIIQGLYAMQVPEAEIGQLTHDFDWLLALPDPLANRYYQSMTTFEEEKSMPHLSTAERIGRREGRKEGRVEGRVEEAWATTLDILEAKIGTVPQELASRLMQIHDLERLRRLRKQLLSGMSLADFEQALNNGDQG